MEHKKKKKKRDERKTTSEVEVEVENRISKKRLQRRPENKESLLSLDL